MALGSSRLASGGLLQPGREQPQRLVGGVKSPALTNSGVQSRPISDIRAECPGGRPVGSRAFRRRPYSGTPSRLSAPGASGAGDRRCARCLRGSAGGCACLRSARFAVRQGPTDKAEATGSIAAGPAARQGSRLRTCRRKPTSSLRARPSPRCSARGGKDVSAPWENPQTGARGTVTPIATAYAQDGLTCRDFLASYVQAAAEAWLQGEACRSTRAAGRCAALRPWKRT